MHVLKKRMALFNELWSHLNCYKLFDSIFGGPIGSNFFCRRGGHLMFLIYIFLLALISGLWWSLEKIVFKKIIHKSFRVLASNCRPMCVCWFRTRPIERTIVVVSRENYKIKQMKVPDESFQEITESFVSYLSLEKVVLLLPPKVCLATCCIYNKEENFSVKNF